MSDPRFSDRRRRHRRRWWVRIVVGLVVVAVTGGLVWVVGYSTLLSVRQVEVTGLERAEESDVLQAAGVPLGRPLVRVDTDAVADRVGDLPRVESVEVSRSWPRTVSVDVTERAAVGYVATGSDFVVFDRHGVEFLERSERPRGLVEIGYAGPPEERSDVLPEVAEVMTAIREADGELWDDVERMEVAGRDAIEFVLGDDTRIRWGSADRTEEKLEVLSALREQPARVYDVTAPSQPTTTS